MEYYILYGDLEESRDVYGKTVDQLKAHCSAAHIALQTNRLEEYHRLRTDILLVAKLLEEQLHAHLELPRAPPWSPGGVADLLHLEREVQQALFAAQAECAAQPQVLYMDQWVMGDEAEEPASMLAPQGSHIAVQGNISIAYSQHSFGQSGQVQHHISVNIAGVRNPCVEMAAAGYRYSVASFSVSADGASGFAAGRPVPLMNLDWFLEEHATRRTCLGHVTCGTGAPQMYKTTGFDQPSHSLWDPKFQELQVSIEPTQQGALKSPLVLHLRRRGRHSRAPRSFTDHEQARVSRPTGVVWRFRHTCHWCVRLSGTVPECVCAAMLKPTHARVSELRGMQQLFLS